MVKSFSLPESADRLADIMIELSKSVRAASGGCTRNALIKLPPYFSNSRKYNIKKNLTAMLKVLHEYEDSDNNPTLSELPSLFNKYGGSPKLTDKDVRRVHNWVHQIGFGLRATAIEVARREGIKDIADTVCDWLYNDDTRRTFVACDSANKNEYKPLRYASREAKYKWINEEVEQLANNEPQFGAKPTSDEWFYYGLKGQSKCPSKKITENAKQIARCAYLLDESERYVDADKLDARIARMVRNLEMLQNWEKK
jgi:hypothetical protein